MRFRLKSLLTTGAVVVLAAAALAPVAGATSSPAGMMPTPMPRPTSTMMPAPTPSPGSTTAPGGWCGGGIWNGGGSGQWGGTGVWGMGSGTGWLASNPAALQAWLQLRTDQVKALQTWHETYMATSPQRPRSRPCTTSGQPSGMICRAATRSMEGAP